MAVLGLEWADERTGAIVTFVTGEAEWNGERWNGFPAPKLPKWQMFMLTLLMTDDDPVTPRAQMDEERTLESAYVHADGLTWIEPCERCGMPHTSLHECEEIG